MGRPFLAGRFQQDLVLSPGLVQLVFRLLLIWAVVIAAMTLYGWTQ